ncbi:glycosyltransferase [Tenacibaculum piscium]|nr:glycosyltransferase [Tenacibaculum piscium]MBE7690250.1 glycosyltransferase [Tenacibaculum piscium]
MFLRKIWLKIIKKLNFLSAPYYIKHYYEYYSGKKLNLEKPVEFNEKISWYKAFYQPKILHVLVDKYAVRDFIKEKIGEEYLNECYGVYKKPAEVDFEKLPNQFVLKGTHGCNINLVVKDKTTLDKKKTKLLMAKWLRKNQYKRTGKEWAYKDVKPRIIAEKFIKDERDSLTDYKFYCFNGTPKFLEVHLDRDKNHKSAFYDFDFKKLPFSDSPKDKLIQEDFEKPQTLSKMVELAGKLSEGFPFVRVDFYSVEDKITFGEMTFYPGDARNDFYPAKYNKIIGDYFELPKIPAGEKLIKKHLLNESY